MTGGDAGNRHPSDYYQTPREATWALLHVAVDIGMPRSVWECACGSGDISRELKSAGMCVVSTDIEYHGYGRRQDFLTTRKSPAPGIVTNPPFRLAVEFIIHARSLGVDFLALLLKATFWHAAERKTLFDRWPPAFVVPLAWRLDFDGRGAPTMECAWQVWRTGITRHTRYLSPALRPARLPLLQRERS